MELIRIVYIVGVLVVVSVAVTFVLFRNGKRVGRIRRLATTLGRSRGTSEELRAYPLTQEEATWASLNRRVGLKSKVAGVGFAVLTAVLLVLSQVTQSIVFEIDSLVAFLAALVLLLSEPRRRVHASLVDAILSSNEMSIADFAAKESDTYEYVPRTKGVSGVILTPASHAGLHLAAGNGVLRVTPPGRALAELFMREAGVSSPTFESLQASLPQVISENFGLANSARLTREGDLVRVVLGRPSFECPCSNGGLAGRSGVVGCTVGSFIAVLVCAAEGRSLELQSCQRDSNSDTLEIAMRLESGEGKQ